MRTFAALTAITAVLFLGSQSLAADLPKEGTYDFVSCFVGIANPMTFSKTHTASTSEFRGTNATNPPGGLFDKVAFRCISMDHSFDGKAAATTVCESEDKDGDKYLTHIVAAEGKTTRTIVAGTGKYDGIVASGTVEGLGPFGVPKPGSLQSCSRQKGTYKLK